VLYESPNPQWRRLRETLVSEFIEQSQEMRWKSTQCCDVTTHLDEMKTKRNSRRRQLQDYVLTSGLTLTSDKQNLAEMGSNNYKTSSPRRSRPQSARRNSKRRKNKQWIPSGYLGGPTMRDFRQKLVDLQRSTPTSVQR